MNDGLKVGERAWRITGGKHQGRLCWTSSENISRAKREKTKIDVQLVTENVPYYGTWGGETVTINPKHLTEVWVVARWSDQV